VDIDAVADRLYSLRPDEFIAARDAEVAAAKKAGDREKAKMIGALRRPTVSAWLINALVRALPELTAELGRLGERMRQSPRALRRRRAASPVT